MAQSLAEQMRHARREEEVKDIFQNYFNLGNVGLGAIDLSLPYIYFEAKHENTDIYRMLAQLMLTIHRDADKIDFPEYIGGFDNVKCGFTEFDPLYQALNTASDMNWLQTPSAVDTKTIDLVRRFAEGKVSLYQYQTDFKELKSALSKIIAGRGLRGQVLQKKINANNFVSIFMKWQKELGNNIRDIDSDYNKKAGITPGDFYLADLLSEDNEAIPELEKLKILRSGNAYKSNVKIDGRLFTTDYAIINPDRHNQFWNKYRRPPKREYWQVIQERRDLLVPQKVREITGAFFTPQIWVEKSQEYMAAAFGDDFKDMYIWDCAAGTGNLLVGLPQEKRNIFASTLMEPDVEIMRQNSNLFENQVFQFDFLNDDFKPVRDGGKMPDRLYDIIQNDEKRKKLIIYINPPYAEAANNKKIAGKNGKKAVEETKIGIRYNNIMSHAKKELFAQFIMRIYKEIPDCIIAEFSTLKAIQAPRFSVFRQSFLAKLQNSFIVPADTFENVKGQFPIGFKIWDTSIKSKIKSVAVDILDRNGEYIGRKHYFSYDKIKFINDWAKIFRAPFNVKGSVATMVGIANDFQQQNLTFITKPYKKVIASNHNFQITENNLVQSVIYFSVRHAIPATWLNDRDQFLYPISRPITDTDNLLEARQEFLYESDDDFKNNCLIYTLFHTQNRISSNDGTNHWIPFTEDDVGCASAFDSNFMSRFLAARNIPVALSSAALGVYNAGLAIWRYYHTRGANPNASLYDIKEFFKGRKDNGKMNNKSDDTEFNRLESELTTAIRNLAAEIEPKIYEYGFLRK
ncbi:MAG: hypothetical protein ACI4NZ_01735 [Candidatus Enterousia sp.]